MENYVNLTSTSCKLDLIKTSRKLENSKISKLQFSVCSKFWMFNLTSLEMIFFCVSLKKIPKILDENPTLN